MVWRSRYLLGVLNAHLGWLQCLRRSKVSAPRGSLDPIGLKVSLQRSPVLSILGCDVCACLSAAQA